MAKREILQFPDPRLRTVAQRVEVFDQALQTLIDDMFETMYAAPGIGLAATQIDVHQRVVVIDVSEDANTPQVFINPEIVTTGTELAVAEEGCLSIVGYTDEVERPTTLVVKAQDRHGSPYELQADGLLARCIQHEVDHLEGRLFIDSLSALKRNRLRRRFEKAARSRAEAKTGTGGA